MTFIDKFRTLLLDNEGDLDGIMCLEIVSLHMEEMNKLKAELVSLHMEEMEKLKTDQAKVAESKRVKVEFSKMIDGESYCGCDCCDFDPDIEVEPTTASSKDKTTKGSKEKSAKKKSKSKSKVDSTSSKAKIDKIDKIKIDKNDTIKMGEPVRLTNDYDYESEDIDDYLPCGLCDRQKCICTD